MIPTQLHTRALAWFQRPRLTKWGVPFTDEERLAHRVARKRWFAEGGVPNIFSSESAPEPPKPWLCIRRMVIARFVKTFGQRRSHADQDELLAHVLRCVAERFQEQEIREHQGRVVAYAEAVLTHAIADAIKGVRRYSDECDITPGLAKIAGHAPYLDDDEEEDEEGALPLEAAVLASKNEDDLIAAIDAQRLSPILGSDEPIWEISEIDILSESFLRRVGLL